MLFDIAIKAAQWNLYFEHSFIFMEILEFQ